MKLLFKFNFIFLVVMALGIGVSGYITNLLLRQQAQEETMDKARLLMDKAQAVRGYTSGQITKLLETQMKYEFLPQSVPSYSAVEVLTSLQKSYPEYLYKEATLNPTNPRDRANGWEVDVVNQFRSNGELKEVVGERDTPGGRSLYLAKPLKITNPACLQCHSSVEAAPKTATRRAPSCRTFRRWTSGMRREPRAPRPRRAPRRHERENDMNDTPWTRTEFEAQLRERIKTRLQRS